ncbi:unnamed protein product, partial [Schistosoma curassoni]|uniref:Carn_acyltransf domain-containing protein n=1 Tax=Schistosoma curassoni TaxID=6186 RepID=A0A183JSH0_9TREM
PLRSAYPRSRTEGTRTQDLWSRTRSLNLQTIHDINLKVLFIKKCILTIFFTIKIQMLLISYKSTADDLDLYILRYKQYGREFPKTVNMSPDSFIQLALQLIDSFRLLKLSTLFVFNGIITVRKALRRTTTD